MIHDFHHPAPRPAVLPLHSPCSLVPAFICTWRCQHAVSPRASLRTVKCLVPAAWEARVAEHVGPLLPCGPPGGKVVLQQCCQSRHRQELCPRASWAGQVSQLRRPLPLMTRMPSYIRNWGRTPLSSCPPSSTTECMTTANLSTQEGPSRSPSSKASLLICGCV